jgi:hypothetical protein
LAISVWHGDPQLFPSVRATEKSDDVDSSAQGPSQLLAFLLACLGDAVGGVLLDRFREADSRLGSISKPIVVAREEVASLMKRWKTSNASSGEPSSLSATPSSQTMSSSSRSFNPWHRFDPRSLASEALLGPLSTTDVP